jgi:hypothetical protein
MMRITVGQLRTLIREAMQELNPDLSPDCDTFAVFDFDETLALTKSEILVVDDAGAEIKRLTPAKYAVYIPEPGENFDFSDFDIVKEGEPTQLVSVLRYVAGCGPTAAAILTARGPKAQEPIRQFFADMGIKLQIIDTVNTSDPQAKARKIKGYVRSYAPRVLHFFEDSPKNLDAVKKMAETDREFENVDVILHKMVDGDKVDVEHVEYKGLKPASASEDSNFV